MNISVVTAPDAEPVSLTEAKSHLRVEHDTDDDLINALIIAAREWVENYLNRAIITQTRKLTIDRFPLCPLRLSGRPIQEISSIKYIDSDGAEGTVDSGEYYLTDSGEVALDYGGQWPSVTLRGPESINITYVCGYGDNSSSVPQCVRQAVLLLIGTWYENREGSMLSSSQSYQNEIPFGVRELLWPIRDVVV